MTEWKLARLWSGFGDERHGAVRVAIGQGKRGRHAAPRSSSAF